MNGKDLNAGTYPLNVGTLAGMPAMAALASYPNQPKKLRLRQRTKARFRRKHRLYEETEAAIEEHRKLYPWVPASQIIENWRQASERERARFANFLAALGKSP